MIPVPITRKGCKNIGWVWSKDGDRLIVKLHKNKPMKYMVDLDFLQERKPRPWWMFWRRK